MFRRSTFGRRSVTIRLRIERVTELEARFYPPQTKVWENGRDGGDSPWSARWEPPPISPDNRWTVHATFKEQVSQFSLRTMPCWSEAQIWAHSDARLASVRRMRLRLSCYLPSPISLVKLDSRAASAVANRSCVSSSQFRLALTCSR